MLCFELEKALCSLLDSRLVQLGEFQRNYRELFVDLSDGF